MRVITGKAKGRKLVAPKSQLVRPALDKIKEAIFSILFDITDLNVLDVFAGSGSIGIEALSRGAAHVTFIDIYQPAIDTIRKNLEICGFSKQATILRSPAINALLRLNKKNLHYDLIFVDPPYLKDLVNPTLSIISESNLLKDHAKIVVEHHPKEPILEQPNLSLVETRLYGQTCISFLENKKPRSI
ncbi:MAG: 16S rRNA (guanine(966)-N(2))-methyltransferase RsmD [Pseudomonadota bacterium]